jgi:nicotinate-nucleotide--dimethylbenzimidazole phosphoribosyltransferase
MLVDNIKHKINTKTKPLGALGVLEKIALQIGTIQNTLSPELKNPTIVVFAGDHGIAKHGTSAYPQEVTYQMVLNFLQSGAAINVFCNQNGIALKVVDAGVNFDFEPNSQLIDAKIAKGTKSFLTEKAMTNQQLMECKNQAKTLVSQLAATDCNVIGFGEMGIGNTSAASLIMSTLCDLSIEKCIGRGTGLNDEQLKNKTALLTQSQTFHGSIKSPEEVLQTFGGFEIAHICYAMLAAKEYNMVILVDGFIATSAYLVASKIVPDIKENAIFCHLSDESGHLNLLNYLDAKPLLQLSMRLGEGTGCAVAYPIIQSAVSFLNLMASFESAGVSNNQ